MRVRIFVREDGTYGFTEAPLIDKDTFEVSDTFWREYGDLFNRLNDMESTLYHMASKAGARPL